MRQKKQPAIPGQREAGQIQNKELFYEPNLTPGALEKSIKNWAIDRLAEALFDGANSPEHRLAERLWKKSRRRLRGA